MKAAYFLLSVVFITGCLQRSQDPLIDVEGEWADADYILSQRGNSVELAILQAEELVSRREYRRAWQVLNNSELRYAVNPDYSFLKGKVQYELGNYERAAEFLEDAEQLGYSQQELFELLVRANLALGREENATGLSALLVEREPTATNLNLRAQVMFAIGDTLQARRLFRQSIRLDSGIQSNYIGLGEIYLSQNDLQSATALMSAGRRKFQDDTEMAYLYISVLEASGEYRAANRIAGALLSNRPEDADLLALRARLFMGSRQYDSAVYAATTSLVYKDQAETRLILANALERQRLYADALRVYQEVYTADSTNTTAADGVRRLEGRRRYLEYLRRQRQDSAQQDAPTSNSTQPDGQ